MVFASLRASYARYILVLSLLSGLTCFQYAPFVAAAVDADDALGLCQVDTLPKDIRDKPSNDVSTAGKSRIPAIYYPKRGRNGRPSRRWPARALPPVTSRSRDPFRTLCCWCP